MKEGNMDPDDILYEFVYIAERFGLNHQQKRQLEWAELGLKWLEKSDKYDEVTDHTIGCLYYFAAQYKKALIYFEKVYHEQPRYTHNLSRLGCTYVQLGQLEKAQMILNQSQQLFEETKTPWFLVIQSHIYSTTGEKDKAVDFFAQAIKAGQIYLPALYENDIMFASLHGYPPFEELVKLRE